MTEQEMLNKSFQRPKNFFELSTEEQWRIDKSLNILDWKGDNLSEKDQEKFKQHYKTN